MNPIYDEKAKAKRTAGNEDRETLHEHVGGVISNPITSDSPDEAERKGGSGTRSGTGGGPAGYAESTSKATGDTTKKPGGSSTGATSETWADPR